MIDKDDLKRKYEQLPEDLQGILFSNNIAEQIQEIGKKFSLHTDQVGSLYDLVNLVLSGVIYIKDFVKKLSSSLEVSEVQARMIAQEINNQIFSKVLSFFLL